MSLLQEKEAKDTTRWMAIWEPVTIAEEGTIRVYKLTRAGYDRVLNAVSQRDLQEVRTELFNLREFLSPLLMSRLKTDLLKVLDSKRRRMTTLTRRIPYSSVYRYSEILAALRELVAEGTAIEDKFGWRKK